MKTPEGVMPTAIALALLTCLLALGAPGQELEPSAGTEPFPAAPAEESSQGHAPIVWVGTVTTNIVYIPAKCVYAAFGAITGGLGWLLTGGNTEAANGIWLPTCAGTYLVTPAMMEGKEECRFVGP